MTLPATAIINGLTLLRAYDNQASATLTDDCIHVSFTGDMHAADIDRLKFEGWRLAPDAGWYLAPKEDS